MKKGIITDIDWAFIGAELACESDDDQAAFFKSFIKEMKSWGTNHRADQQMAFINLQLNNPEKEFLEKATYRGES